ncbi:hypothetical protein QFC22_000960 [Naganishia vaughanmartiniae]|uniref:Uncharacterized protein n=1 Tax=Naganishia vaughanmartiniae TaxID=1424756 RepID=A0ACC2XJH9_9TREE|nr:hypothetical protein QFC22_000960 [Naganishia vaughanmartiniae]
MVPPMSDARSTPHPALQGFVQPSTGTRHAQPQPLTLPSSNPQVGVHSGLLQTPSVPPSLLRSHPRNSLDPWPIQPTPLKAPSPSTSPPGATGVSDAEAQNYEPLNLFKDIFPRMRQMLDINETSCQSVVGPEQETVFKLNGVIRNLDTLNCNLTNQVRSKVKEIEQVQTVHLNLTNESKKRMAALENDLRLEKGATSLLRRQKNELELMRKEEMADLQKSQARRDDLLREVDKLKREHVMAMGTLKIVHAAELKQERDQRKKFQNEKETQAVLPDQASLIDKLEAKIQAQAQAISNLELENISLTKDRGKLHVDNGSNGTEQKSNSISPDEPSMIRDLEAKVAAQTQVISKLEREKLALKQDYERINSEGEIVGFADRGQDGNVKAPRRRAGRPRGSKNRVSATSLPSPPSISFAVSSEENEIFQGLSGRQVLMLKRKAKNNVITKELAKDEANRLRLGADAITSPVYAGNATPSGSSEPTLVTSTYPESGSLEKDAYPVSQVYATDAIRIEVKIAKDAEDQPEKQMDWLEKFGRIVENRLGEVGTTGKEHDRSQSQSLEQRSMTGHHHPTVHARQEITRMSEQQRKPSEQDFGRLSTLAELATSGKTSKKDITLESIQELLVVLSPLQSSIPPTSVPSTVPPSRSPKSRLPLQPLLSRRAVPTLSHHPVQEYIEVDPESEGDRASPAGFGSATAHEIANLPSTNPSASQNSTRPAHSNTQPMDRKRKGNNPYPPAGKVPRKTGPGCC